MKRSFVMLADTRLGVIGRRAALDYAADPTA
jgi:hypothetical protein